MKKKLFVYATLFSLLCCATTIYMWIGSSEKVTTLALRTRGESSVSSYGAMAGRSPSAAKRSAIRLAVS